MNSGPSATPAYRLGVDLVMICHFASQAHILSLLCVGFLTTRWSAFLTIVVSLIAALLTVALFRAFNPIRFTDVWPLFAFYPAGSLCACAIASLFRHYRASSTQDFPKLRV